MKRYRVRVSARARDDLRAIVARIARDKPLAARRFLARLRRRIQVLGSAPRLGRVVPELSIPVYRELIIAPYRVIYRLDPRARRVDVVTVWHGARLLELE